MALTKEALAAVKGKINFYTLKNEYNNNDFNIFKKYGETKTTTGAHYDKQTNDGGVNDPKNWPTNIYAENFSNHINPQSIYTNIEFRVGSKEIKNAQGEKETVPNWVALNSQNNNVFFKDLNIVDNGGVQKLTLNLYDKEFTNLEMLVRGAVATAQLVMGQSGGMEKLSDIKKAEEEANERIYNEAKQETAKEEEWIKLLKQFLDQNDDPPETPEEYKQLLCDKFKLAELTKRAVQQYGAVEKKRIPDPELPYSKYTSDDIQKTINFANFAISQMEEFIKNGKFEKNTIVLNKDAEVFYNSMLGFNFNYYNQDKNVYVYQQLIPPLENMSNMQPINFNFQGFLVHIKNLFTERMIKAGISKDIIDQALLIQENNLILKDGDNVTILIPSSYQNYKLQQWNETEHKEDIILIPTEFSIFPKNHYISLWGKSDYDKTDPIENLDKFIKNYIDLYEISALEGSDFFLNEDNDVVPVRLIELYIYKGLKKWWGDGINTDINDYYYNEEINEKLKKEEEQRRRYARSTNTSAILNMKHFFQEPLNKNCVEGTGEPAEKTPGRYIIEEIFSFFNKVSEAKREILKIRNDPKGFYKKGAWDYIGELFSGNDILNYDPKQNEYYYKGKKNFEETLKQALDDIKKLFELTPDQIWPKINEAEAKINAITNEAISRMSKNFEVMKVDTELQANLRISIGYTDKNATFAGIRKNEEGKSITSETGTEANNWRNYFFGKDSGSYNARWWEVGNKIVDSDKASESITFTDIVNAKMQNCIRGPNFHYFITNVASKINNNGLFYTIEAFSLTSELINKYKIVQKYMNIVGEPELMLSSLMTVFNENLKPTSSNIDKAEYKNGVYLAWGDAEYTIDNVPIVWERRENASIQDSSSNTRDDIKESNFEEKTITDNSPIQRYIMKIPLGGEESKTNPNIYRPLSSLLNDFCSKFPMMVVYEDDVSKQIVKNISIDGEPIDRNGNKIAPDGEVITRDSGDAGYSAQSLNTRIKKYQLTWACKQLGVSYKDDYTPNEYNENGILIWFYYKKPKKYQYIRNYDWGKIDTSVVKNLDISNKSEFATISSITVFDRNTGGTGYNDPKEKGTEQLQALSIYGMQQNIPIEMEKDKPLIVNRFAPVVPRDYKARYYNMIQEAYMHGVYEGKIQIVGDPGLFTNRNLCPYLWPIRLNIFVPKYVQDITSDNTKDSVGQTGTGIIPYHEEFQLNYMSGIYVVTSIEHNISNSGYTTTLGVLRWPGLDDDVVGKNVKKNQETDFNKLFRSRQLTWMMLNDQKINVDGMAVERAPTIMQIIHLDEQKIGVNEMEKFLKISPARGNFTQNDEDKIVYLKITDGNDLSVSNIKINPTKVSESEDLLNVSINYITRDDIYEIKFSRKEIGAVKLSITAGEGYAPVEAFYSVSLPYTPIIQQFDSVVYTTDRISGIIPNINGKKQDPNLFGPYTTAKEIASVVWNELGNLFKKYGTGEKEITISIANSLINQNNFFRENPSSETKNTSYKPTALKNRNGSGSIWNAILSDVEGVIANRDGKIGGKGADFADGMGPNNMGTAKDGYIGNKIQFFNTGGSAHFSLTRRFARYPTMMLAPVPIKNDLANKNTFIAGYYNNYDDENEKFGVELAKSIGTVDVPYNKYITVVFTNNKETEPYLQNRLNQMKFKEQTFTEVNNGIDLIVKKDTLSVWEVIYNKMYKRKINTESPVSIDTSFKLMNTICTILSNLNGYVQ
jgi:hypothetical protein